MFALPETKAAGQCINRWLDDQENLAPLTPVPRGVDSVSFVVRGVTINSLAQPYRFYLLQRVQEAFENLSAPEQCDVDALLTACDMREILGIKLSRKIGRKDNFEVWL